MYFKSQKTFAGRHSEAQLKELTRQFIIRMEEQIQHLRETSGIELPPSKTAQPEFLEISPMAISPGKISLLTQDDLLNNFLNVLEVVIMAKSSKADKEAVSEDAQSLPREPDTKKGKQVRERFFTKTLL